MLLGTEIIVLSSHLPQSLKIFLLQNSTGDLQTQRLALRKTLCQQLASHQYEAPQKLEDLLLLPKHPELSLSLSHAPNYSAIAWCSLPLQIGVDIEELLRVKKTTTARVSSSQEQALAPRLDLLWSCKEAVFKALSPHVKILSSVEIFDWQMLKNEIWSFRARESQSQQPFSGQGEVRLVLGHSLAFFVCNP